MKSKLGQFVKGAAILAISNVLIKATNFFLLPLYTKYLSPEQMGISDTIINLMSIVFPLLVMAFDSAFGAFYYEDESEDYKKRILNTTFFFLLVMSCLVVIPVLASDFLSELMFDTDAYSFAIDIAMFSVAVNMWFLPFSLLIRIQNRMTIFSVINFVASLSMILLNVYFVTVLNLEYFSLILSNLLIHILQLIMFFSAAKTTISIRHFDKTLFMRMLQYALPMVPMILSNWLLALSDRYVLLYYKGEYEVGIYSIAARFMSVLTLVTNAIFTAFSAYAFSTKNDNDAKRQYVFVLDAVHIFLFIITMCVSIFAKEILWIMVDPEYYSATPIIGPLLLGQVCYSANTIVGYGFAFEKKSYYFLVPAFSGAIVNLVLNIILIPKWGALAAAWTTFIGYAVMLIISYILGQRVYPCGFRFGKLIITLVLGGLIVVITTYFSFGLKCLIMSLLSLICYFLYKDIIKEIFNKFLKIRS